MRRLLALVGLSLAPLLAFCWSVAAAQEADIVVDVSPEGAVTVGDVVEIRITVRHEIGDRVLVEPGALQLGSVEPSAALRTAISGSETLIVYRTRSFRVGRFDVPLPDVRIARSDGSIDRRPLRPVTVEVQSVLSDPPQAQPLTDPDLIEGGARTFAPWIVAIIGVGVGFALARVVRRRRATPMPAPTSNEVVDAAHSTPSFEMDSTRSAAEQCRQLSAAVRDRLAEDWPLPATALTASEIGPALARAGAPSSVVLRVTQLLEACDRVQFGGETPAPERLRGYAAQAAAIWSEVAHED